jgi:Ni,Fe-hydrogenase III small subunit/ferredoxin-like protein FixX
MLAWVLRGLRRGIVTSRYPRTDARTPPTLRSAIELIDPDGADPALADLCPTGAIAVRDGRVTLDRGRCVLCGSCVVHAPERFAYRDGPEISSRHRSALVAGVSVRGADDLRPTLAEQRKGLRRSVHIRHVDAGSDGAEEWEIQALTGPYYDIQRLGLFFTSAPRHADILLVTGGVTMPMVEPLLRAYEVMPAPKAVVAVGSDACSGGFARDGTEVAGGVDQVLPVDVYIPGSPPDPITILHGLLLAVGVLSEDAT